MNEIRMCNFIDLCYLKKTVEIVYGKNLFERHEISEKKTKDKLSI